ncbi:MAG: ATP synthase complex assembly protein atp12 [Claussenomyces sp. TS43310]|nr:MAG: ATP synthase complex assembly protein atp12 [Claussenomyces sp. TS43310]
MKRVISPGSIASTACCRVLRPSPRFIDAAPQRCLHTTPRKPADVAPLTASAPPPPAPLPSAEHAESRIARRRQQAELLKRGQDLRAINAGTGKGTAKAKRFWKDVHVVKADDKRPLRTPSKQILAIPHHKPHLASSIALEWDLLVSNQQALRTHMIPLTSLVSRALDIEEEDRAGSGSTRQNITSMLMRYLETDSLLCWAPQPDPDPPGYESHVGRTESLRDIQMRMVKPLIAFLTERVWPGIDIVPVLDEGTIMPKPQPPGTREVIQGWITGLPPFELAGLERAVLAQKSLLGGVRLIVEWSPELAHLHHGRQPAQRFGIDEAERVASLEVTYQTDMWGEVEDSHDVQKEDLRRQLGSVILLVSGLQKA